MLWSHKAGSLWGWGAGSPRTSVWSQVCCPGGHPGPVMWALGPGRSVAQIQGRQGIKGQVPVCALVLVVVLCKWRSQDLVGQSGSGSPCSQLCGVGVWRVCSLYGVIWNHGWDSAGLEGPLPEALQAGLPWPPLPTQVVTKYWVDFPVLH